MKNITQKIRSYIISNKYFVLLIIFYFLLRLVNILGFPIFNDEAIYLDWGWRETHVPGYLYYSLYDAKQPLLMWIFGIMQQLLPDPLFAGRLVSIIVGFFTFLGIYKISENLFDKKVSILASFLYVIIPIFSFFDRQALMESSISAVGVWTLYFLLRIIERKSYKYAVYLGIILGIGFFIKSSTLVFLIAFLFLSFFILKASSKKINVVEIVFLTLFIFFCTTLLLIINPEFWETFESNSRFTLTVSQLISFPVSIWSSSIFTNIRILFFYFTPVLFIFSLIGIFKIYTLSFKHKIFLLFIIISILFETFTIKGASDRYLVAFIPALTICASFILVNILNKNKLQGFFLIILAVLIPISITIYQIVDFPNYIKNMGNISGFTNSAYLVTNTSGYGVNETVNYFEKLSKNEKFIIGIAQNTGNPESALQIYFNKKENPKVVYIDSSLFEINLNDYECLSTGVKTYFVSRDNQQAGLDKFLVKVTSFKNPYGDNFIGIYKLNEQCKGKTKKVIIRRSTE